MAKHAGGRPRKLSAEDERRVVREHQKGTMLYEITYMFKISEKTFRRIISRNLEKEG